MNKLEDLMIAELKKMAIEKSVEDEKVNKWHEETLEKLSFLENYECEFCNKYCNDKSKIHITHGRQMIEIALAGSCGTDKIWRYDLDKPLEVDWRYNSASANDKSELTLEEFVKTLARRGVIKMED